MDDFPKRQLLINYLLGLCTSREVKEVEHWLNKEPGNVALLQKVAKEIGRENNNTVSNREKKEIRKDVFKNIQQDRGKSSTRKKVRGDKKLVRPSGFGASGLWLKVAAFAFLILTAGGLSFYYGNKASVEEKSAVVLKERTLSDGQKATLRFSDGSVIHLNAGSTLRYPSRFSSDIREVYLEGEAFFSVESDTARPFIIHAGETETRVLGTAFNIRAYESEKKVQVAVQEGKVAVTKKANQGIQKGETVCLRKNQWVTYHQASQLTEQGEGDIWEMVAWKDKVLVFNDRDLGFIAERLERWYNIDVSLADPTLADRRMSASFEEKPMTDVLTVIALSLGISYSKEDRSVTFYKPK